MEVRKQGWLGEHGFPVSFSICVHLIGGGTLTAQGNRPRPRKAQVRHGQTPPPPPQTEIARQSASEINRPGGGGLPSKSKTTTAHPKERRNKEEKLATNTHMLNWGRFCPVSVRASTTSVGVRHPQVRFVLVFFSCIPFVGNSPNKKWRKKK